MMISAVCKGKKTYTLATTVARQQLCYLPSGFADVKSHRNRFKGDAGVHLSCTYSYPSLILQLNLNGKSRE